MPELIDLSRATHITANDRIVPIHNFGATDTRIIVNGCWYEQADCSLSVDGSTILAAVKEAKE